MNYDMKYSKKNVCLKYVWSDKFYLSTAMDIIKLLDLEQTICSCNVKEVMRLLEDESCDVNENVEYTKEMFG